MFQILNLFQWQYICFFITFWCIFCLHATIIKCTLGKLSWIYELENHKMATIFSNECFYDRIVEQGLLQNADKCYCFFVLQTNFQWYLDFDQKKGLCDKNTPPPCKPSRAENWHICTIFFFRIQMWHKWQSEGNCW